MCFCVYSDHITCMWSLLVYAPSCSAFKSATPVTGSLPSRFLAYSRPLRFNISAPYYGIGCACKCSLQMPSVRAVVPRWTSMETTPSYAGVSLSLLAFSFSIAHFFIPLVRSWHLPYGLASPPPPHVRRCPKSGRGSWQTKPPDILLYSWRGDSHCCVDLIGVSLAQSGRRDAASALPFVEQGKRDKHTATCRSHGFDFIPFGFSTFGSFGPSAEELPSHTVPMHRSQSGRRMHGYSAGSPLLL